MKQPFYRIGVVALSLNAALGGILVVSACSSSGEKMSPGIDEDVGDAGPSSYAEIDADASRDGGDADVGEPPPDYDFAVRCTAQTCVKQIAARGGAHACALLADRSVHCWGANVSGQLGIGGSDGGAAPLFRATPRPVHGIANATLVAAAGAGTSGYTCVVGEAGDVTCFGSNASGQLGVDAGNSREPLVVPNVRATSIALTPTFALAISPDARLWSWGVNDNLQLAHSLTGSDAGTSDAGVRGPALAARLTPSVRGCAGTAKNAFAVSDHGAVLSWGAGTIEQLGRASSLASDPVPSALAVPEALAVTAGAVHACALSRGSVHCWGQNNSGQLGTTRKADESFPARVALPDGVYPVHVAAGGDNTCIISARGELYCWGANHGGQLGSSPGVDQAAPVRIGDSKEETVGVAIMDGAICALTRSGSVLCLGENHVGQLGRGARDPDIHVEPASVAFE